MNEHLILARLEVAEDLRERARVLEAEVADDAVGQGLGGVRGNIIINFGGEILVADGVVVLLEGKSEKRRRGARDLSSYRSGLQRADCDAVDVKLTTIAIKFLKKT